MIRVTVEIVPQGVESMKKTVFALTIFNDGTGTKEFGNYQYMATETVDDMVWENFWNQEQKKVTYGGEVKHFRRRRTVKELIEIVLKQMIKKGERCQTNLSNESPNSQEPT